jgi:subtilisin family serine protease
MRTWRIGALFAALLATGVAGGLPAAASARTERYVVVFDTSLQDVDGAIDRRESAGDFKASLRFRHALKGFAARLTASQVQRLREDDRVTLVAEDGEVSASDALLAGETLPSGIRRIEAGSPSTAQAAANSAIAVIDTGIQLTHPDLNAVNGTNCTGSGSANDNNGHGTHVAGTIAARDDDAGVVGVAPEATIYALKVLDQNGNGSFSGVISALDWAVAHGVQITSNSYGSAQNPGTIVQQAFDNAAAHGILNVAAAGNSGNCQGTGDNVIDPGKYDSVIAVAAVDAADAAACFSSTGPKVELAAPGVAVTSTVPGGGYDTFSGTSMATPHVTGVAALVLARGVIDNNGNGRVNDELRSILDQTAQDLGAAGRDTRFGFGLVDAVAAVAGPPPPQPAVAVTVTTNKASYIRGVDTTAQLTVVVANEYGAPIPGLGSGAFSTTLDGVGAAVAFTETATPGRYTGTLDIAALLTGAHGAAVTAIDTRGLSNTGTVSFSVANPVSNSVRAQSITYSLSGGLNGRRDLNITVQVVDGNGAPVANAIVSVIAYRNGGFYGAANGVSNAAGKAIFVAASAPAGCYQTLVAAILAGTRSWDGVTPPNGLCK